MNGRIRQRIAAKAVAADPTGGIRCRGSGPALARSVLLWAIGMAGEFHVAIRLGMTV
jgi:hypothetical protein